MKCWLVMVGGVKCWLVMVGCRKWWLVGQVIVSGGSRW